MVRSSSPAESDLDTTMMSIDACAAAMPGPATTEAYPGSTKMPLPTIAPMLMVRTAYNPRSRFRDRECSGWGTFSGD
jgi:hypothetical protein